MKHRDGVIGHVTWLQLKDRFVLLRDDDSCLWGWSWPRAIVVGGWQIVNEEETLSDVYPARQLEVEGVPSHDGERDMIARDVQVVWESHRFVSGMVVVNLGQRRASIATSQMEAVRSFGAERRALLMLVP
ncbi:hypothetical protein PENSUB_7644 [Penicillium subrubescens]|jgi:hypothetical protein|uniref:Uncharacterized protein n=1 Tax=Penicillium subrubescens TaxID=1316194 RepID=A0A1Q5TLF3_9EURO|nr:hypothetical protein PENSUB_7644 [Penicillium subrubescens]